MIGRILTVKAGSVARFQYSQRCGLRAARARMRCTVRALMAVTWPLSIRQLARSRPLHR